MSGERAALATAPARCDDRRAACRGGEHAEPHRHLDALDARLLHRRHVRHHVGALRAGDRERAQPSGLTCWRIARVGEGELDFARDQRRERGALPL